MILIGQFDEWVLNWLTPVWLLCLAAVIAVVVLAVLWVLAALLGIGIPIFRRAASEAVAIVSEGPLATLVITTLIFAALGVGGAFFAPDRASIFNSLWRVPQMGETLFSGKVPSTPRDELGEPDEAQETEFLVTFNRAEIKSIQMQASENVYIYPKKFEEGARRGSFDVAAGIPFDWIRNSRNLRDFPTERIEQVYVVNRGNQEADISMLVATRPANPEVLHVLIGAGCIVGVVLLYFAQALIVPRVSAIALSTFKSEIAQPMFLILLVLGIVFLAIFLILPGHTMGEDIKMFKDNSLTLIMVFGIVQAVWAAGMSVSEEVEGRTALTVLSKPVTRRAFIGGKYIGILWTVLLLFVLLGLWFMILTSYKPIYDSKETSQELPNWQVCHQEMVDTVPGLSLHFLETAVMASLAVAISTRLPLLANMVICMTIYVLGHLTPVLVDASSGSQQFEVVIFVAKLIATVFPNLEVFNVSPSVAAGVPVPWSYMGMALVYGLVYSTIAMLLALFLFEDRDLA